MPQERFNLRTPNFSLHTVSGIDTQNRPRQAQDQIAWRDCKRYQTERLPSLSLDCVTQRCGTCQALRHDQSYPRSACRIRLAKMKIETRTAYNPSRRHDG